MAKILTFSAPIRAAHEGVGWLLSVAEQMILRVVSDSSMRLPPLFVIGPPRSGTSLMFQLIVHHLGYVAINNLAALFPKSPIIGLWFSRLLAPRRIPLNYESEYGRTFGLWGPSEAGEFWYRWFPRGDSVYVSPGTTSKHDLLELRKEVVGMSCVARAPLVFKNTYNSMRIAPIVESLPEASFVVMQRDPTDVAQSLLLARQRLAGGKSHWFSLPPKEFERIASKPYWEQVSEQVFYIYKQIEEDSSRFGSGRFLNVDYGRLCNDTHTTIGELCQFLESRGMSASVYGDIPKGFKYSSGVKVERSEYDLIKKSVARLWTAN